MRINRIDTREVETIKKTDFDLSLMDSLIQKYKNKKGNMIPLLQGTMELFRYIPREAFEKLEKEVGLKLSDMYGVATFYAQFRLKPVGKHIIKVCHGTACHVQNAGAISDALKETLKVVDGATTEDGLFTLETVACLGCCSLAPVIMIGGETFAKLKGSDAVKVIKDIRLSESN